MARPTPRLAWHGDGRHDVGHHVPEQDVERGCALRAHRAHELARGDGDDHAAGESREDGNAHHTDGDGGVPVPGAEGRHQRDGEKKGGEECRRILARRPARTLLRVRGLRRFLRFLEATDPERPHLEIVDLQCAHM